MCGITGWINFERNLTKDAGIVKAMTDTLKRRGPDNHGIEVYNHALLGHRRLVVVDPAGGAQPMTKKIKDSSYTIVYNGELYNTEDLRKILLSKGYTFNGYSDTEVLLVSYIEWGVECVKYLNGIYAFGVWDEKSKSLFLARDPLGVKPLFYTLKDSSLIFASEIKAILVHPSVDPVLDRQGIMEIFGLGPARPLGSGIFKDIYEVKPATYLLFDCDGIHNKEFWKLESKPHCEDFNTTVDHVRSLFIDAVERQLSADVPVCTFLSGGVDSSAISSIAANTFKRDGRGILNTYSIDYTDNDKYFKPNDFQPNSDGFWVNRMVKEIQSNHHNIIINNTDLAAALKEAVLANDLPGMADIDSSLYLFCKEVRKDSTVALSGDSANSLIQKL